MRGFRAACVVAAVCATPRIVCAQEPVRAAAIVSVQVVPDVVTVGQPFSVRIRVRAPNIATIRFPPVPDTADAIEAVDPRAMEDHSDADMLDRTAVYRLVAWEVGSRTPSFANVTVSVGGADRRYAVSMPPVIVRSLLPADSAGRKPKGVRDPVVAPSGLWRYLLLLAVLLAAIVWYWWWRRARRLSAVPREAEPFAAAVTAFDALDALELPGSGESGRHLIASVDVLRGYLARRFPSLRESFTSHELEGALATSDLPVVPQRVSNLLQRESSVRFARAAISADEAVALSRESRSIVRDIQTAYEARLRALDSGPQRGRRR